MRANDEEEEEQRKMELEGRLNRKEILMGERGRKDLARHPRFLGLRRIYIFIWQMLLFKASLYWVRTQLRNTDVQAAIFGFQFNSEC